MTRSSDDVTLQGLRRAMFVLQALTTSDAAGVSVTALARDLGVSKSTISRLLKTLVEGEFASRLPNGRFQAGPNAIRGALSTVGPLLQDVSPFLRHLSSTTKQTAHLAVLLGARCLIVARSCERERGVHVDEVSEGFPLWATALGKALLAGEAPAVRRNLLPPEPYPQFTPATARTASELFARIARDAGTGVFVDSGEFHTGFRCVAHRISGRGPVTAAAIAVSYPVGAMHWTPLIKQHVRSVAGALTVPSSSAS